LGKVGTRFKAALNPDLTYQITAVLSYDYCEYVIFNSKGVVASAGRFSISDSNSVKEGLQTSGILDLKISKFTLASNAAPINFVASKNFKANKLKSYFKGIYPNGKLVTKKLVANKLKRQRLYAVYGIPKNLLTPFQKLLSKFNLTHLSESMCNYANAKKLNGTLVFIGAGYVAISCHKKGASYFYNKFDCFGDTDVFYYLKLAFEVLELNPAKENIWLGGAVKQKGKLARLLSTEFKKLKWLRGFDRYTKITGNKGAYYAPHFLIKQ